MCIFLFFRHCRVISSALWYQRVLHSSIWAYNCPPANLQGGHQSWWRLLMDLNCLFFKHSVVKIVLTSILDSFCFPPDFAANIFTYRMKLFFQKNCLNTKMFLKKYKGDYLKTVHPNGKSQNRILNSLVHSLCNLWNRKYFIVGDSRIICMMCFYFIEKNSMVY